MSNSSSISTIGTYSASKIVRQIDTTNTKVKVLYGEYEHRTSPKLVGRTRQTAKTLPSAKLVEIAQAPHSFHDANYVRGIKAEL